MCINIKKSDMPQTLENPLYISFSFPPILTLTHILYLSMDDICSEPRLMNH